jgi:hypothetical protein
MRRGQLIRDCENSNPGITTPHAKRCAKSQPSLAETDLFAVDPLCGLDMMRHEKTQRIDQTKD